MDDRGRLVWHRPTTAIFGVPVSPDIGWALRLAAGRYRLRITARGLRTPGVAAVTTVSVLPPPKPKPNNPKAKFTPNNDLIKREDKRPAALKKARPTGTTVRMWPDADIFVPGAKFDVDTIKFRLKSTAFLLPGLRVEINDYRDPANPVEDVYEFDGGIAEMLSTIMPDQPVMKPVHFQTESSFTEMASIVAADGHSTTGEIERKVDIDVAFVYGNGYDNTTRSFVNIINTKHHGTHVQGFERALSRVLVNTIRNTPRMLTAKEESPIIDDVREGITAIISIKFPEPQFTGQEKSTLGTQAITTVVSQAVDVELKKWLENKKNATDMKTMLTKIVNASRNRTAARQAKETARRKTALSSASMPAKLVDCGTNDTQFSELHIVEGDSASGSLEEGRNAEYQALIPIRGKILNAYRASTADVLKNTEPAALIPGVGAGSGRSFDIDQMRYARIIITADADVDGNHIRSLLITLFWQQMRPLVEAGRLYTSVPPLYSVKTNGKNSETIYITDDDEVPLVLERLKREKKSHGPLGRFKGLGEMDPEELRVTTLDPENRILRQITVDDADEAEAMLDLAMGSAVPPRKAWIENYRALIDTSLLDV